MMSRKGFLQYRITVCISYNERGMHVLESELFYKYHNKGHRRNQANVYKKNNLK